MMWSGIVLCFIIAFNSCDSVIYHLNDSEYHRMPHLYHLDRYDSCLAETDGRYCLLKLVLHEGANSDLMKMISEYSLHTNKHLNHSYLQRGVCVTKSCKDFIEDKNVDDGEELSEVLEKCLNASIWKDYKLEAKLTEIYYCDKHNEQTEIDIVDWTVAGVLLALLLLVAVATVYDVNNNAAEVKSLAYMVLRNFSLRKNWRKLVNCEISDPSRQRLKGLHGVRSISICLTMISHAFFFYMIGFNDNPHDIEKKFTVGKFIHYFAIVIISSVLNVCIFVGLTMSLKKRMIILFLDNASNLKSYEKIHFQVYYNGMAIVQIFFVMSAFLQAYIMHVHSETKTFKWSDLPVLLLSRWWRLTPSYAVILAITATWLRHMGSGPLWKLHVTNSAVSDCRRYWWLHLIYLNNYQSNDKWCAIQTWHVASDTQLYVITMLVYFATISRGRSVAHVFLLLVGIVSPALQVWQQDLNPFVFLYPELYRGWADPTFGFNHVRGHNNLTCYVIGLATGSLVYNMHKKNIDLSKSKIKWGVLCWLLIPAIACLFLCGRWFFGDGPRASLAARVLYAGAHRVFIGVLVAMIIISVTMRLSESLSSMLEWNGWLVTSRLEYGVYLVHMNLVHILVGIRTQLTIASLFNLIVLYFGMVVVSVILALPLYLAVEAPLTGLMTMYLKLRYKEDIKKNSKKME